MNMIGFKEQEQGVEKSIHQLLMLLFYLISIQLKCNKRLKEERQSYKWPGRNVPCKPRKYQQCDMAEGLKV